MSDTFDFVIVGAGSGGSALAGRFSGRSNARGSHANPSAITQSTTTIATPVVVHGSRIAMSAVTRSILNIRAAGSCRADQITENHEVSASLLTASAIPLHPLRPGGAGETSPGRRDATTYSATGSDPIFPE